MCAAGRRHEVVVCVSEMSSLEDGCVRKGINTTDNKDVKTASIIWTCEVCGLNERRERVDIRVRDNKRWITKSRAQNDISGRKVTYKGREDGQH